MSCYFIATYVDLSEHNNLCYKSHDYLFSMVGSKDEHNTLDIIINQTSISVIRHHHNLLVPIPGAAVGEVGDDPITGQLDVVQSLRQT